MKLLLVDNLVLPEEGVFEHLDVHPHLGLLALAAVAEAQGHSVRIYDPKRLIKTGVLPYDETLYERVANDLLAESPHAIGFTTLGCSFLFAVNVAALIKRDEPEMPILLGGPHATMLHQQILERFAQFDIIVRYEADEVLPSVLANLEQRQFHGIPGLSWRDPSTLDLRYNAGRPKVEDLDRLPLYSYEHYPVEDLGLNLLRIEAGRGCPFSCTFCSTATFFQRSFRLKSAARLVTELDRLHARYGCADFKLDHDLFTVNRRKVMEFCEAVEKRGYRWRASARVDLVDEELLTRMARAGCVGLYFGIETGSVRMQDISQKHLDLTLVKPTLLACERLGIQTTASFITGYPEEHEQDQADTLDLLGQCFRPSCLPQLHVLAPEPGTPMFEQMARDLVYDGYAGPYNAILTGSSDTDLICEHRDIFSTYHYYPTIMPRARYVFAADAIDVLRHVGPVIIPYTLRAYGGRLSQFVHSLQCWADNIGRGDRADADLMESYIAYAFGQSHHLTSLFRYSLVTKKCTRQSWPEEVPYVASESDPVYQLGPHLHILPELHDCQFLIEQIDRTRHSQSLLEESETGGLGIYLVSIKDGQVSSCEIDEGLAYILGLFQSPRSVKEVTDSLNEAAGSHELDARFFHNLLAQDVLIRRAIPPSPSLPPRETPIAR